MTFLLFVYFIGVGLVILAGFISAWIMRNHLTAKSAWMSVALIFLLMWFWPLLSPTLIFLMWRDERLIGQTERFTTAGRMRQAGRKTRC